MSAAVLGLLLRADEALTAAEVGEQLGTAVGAARVRAALRDLYATGTLDRIEREQHFAYQPAGTSPVRAALRMAGALRGESQRLAVLALFLSMLSDGDRRIVCGLVCQHGDSVAPDE